MHFAIEVKNLRGECATLGFARSNVSEKQSCGLRGFRRAQDIAQRRAFKIDGDPRVSRAMLSQRHSP